MYSAACGEEGIDAARVKGVVVELDIHAVSDEGRSVCDDATANAADQYPYPRRHLHHTPCRRRVKADPQQRL